MTINIKTLFSAETAAQILARGLEIAAALGLDVDSWRTGDPTRSAFKYLAEVLARREDIAVEYTKSGFRSEASGDWLTLHASDVYGVARTEASYATPTVTLTNTGDLYYDLGAGDLTVKATSTGKTFHNTSADALAGGDTVTFDLIADEAGSDSSVTTDEIDALVTSLLGVEIVSSTPATASDEQDDDALDEQCAASLGALSPNGAPDAYEYVARNSGLTGVFDVTRAKSVGDNDTGLAVVYLASASGDVAPESVTAVQDAFEQWCTPLCITPQATNATEHTIAITGTIEGDDIPDDFSDTIESALVTAFAAPSMISDGTVIVARSFLTATIHAAIPGLRRVLLTLPAADVTLAAGEIPVLGALTITEL